MPQTRRRAFLTFIRRDLDVLKRLVEKGSVPYPKPTHALDHGGRSPITLSKALRQFRLPRLDARSKATAQRYVRTGQGLHTVPVWADRRYEMVAAIPANSGASAWETARCPACGPVEVDETMATCPRCRGVLLRPVVEEEGSFRLVKGFHRSSYRRMRADEPAATITTASGRLGSDNTIHPSENRLLSVLECARLQTFPRQFNWGDALTAVGYGHVREMIGEAVPPRFTRLHGEVLASLIGGEVPGDLLSVGDVRCKRARKTCGVKLSSVEPNL